MFMGEFVKRVSFRSSQFNKFNFRDQCASLALLSWCLILSACNSPTTVTQGTVTQQTAVTVAAQQFATGVKGVKIFTGTSAADPTYYSFVAPGAVAASTPIPANFPGYGASYIPGASASRYFNSDGSLMGTTPPSWLLDFQLGITGTGSTDCAAFVNSAGGNLHVTGYYRTSEHDCGAVTDGIGGADPVFMRIILNRDSTVLGAAENLLVQIEYQASGLHLNSDGADPDPEKNLDQVWKIFWNTTLDASFLSNPFSVFVPPNYSACIPGGSGSVGAGGGGDACASGTYTGAPIKTKQVIIPLSAYPTLSVIQLSRAKGRVSGWTATAGDIASFCASDTPLCAGVVIRSVTLLRM